MATGLIVLLVIAFILVVLGGLVGLIVMVAQLDDDELDRLEAASMHVQAMQTAQRIHHIAWRARQAMYEEARRSSPES